MNTSISLGCNTCLVPYHSAKTTLPPESITLWDYFLLVLLLLLLVIAIVDVFFLFCCLLFVLKVIIRILFDLDLQICEATGPSMLPALPIYSWCLYNFIELRETTTLSRKQLGEFRNKIRVGDVVAYRRSTMKTYCQQHRHHTKLTQNINHRVIKVWSTLTKHKKRKWWVQCKGDHNRYLDKPVPLTKVFAVLKMKLTPNWIATIYKYTWLQTLRWWYKTRPNYVFTRNGWSRDDVDLYSYEFARPNYCPCVKK
jgi:hypothetical protein